MGNKPRKISCGAPSQGNPRAENDGDNVSPSASGSSSSESSPAPIQVHCTEVFIVHISPKENEVYILVPPEEMEEPRPQENFEKSSELSPIAMTSGSSEVASGILEEGNAATELANSTTETSVKTDVQPTEADLLCEACQVRLPETPPMPPPKTHETSSSEEDTSDSSSVSEEEAAPERSSVGTLSLGVAEPQEGMEGLHPPSELPKETEVTESVQKASCEVEPELTTDKIQGAEGQAMGQRERNEATPEEALQRTAEPHPKLILAETPDRASVNMAALGDGQLAEDQTDPQNHRPLSVSETEGKIPEECSAVGSWKEREDLCSPKEASTVTELQPDDQKVPCEMCLQLTTESAEVVTEESTPVQGQLDEEASAEKPVDIESHLDSALVEKSGGTSDMGATPGTRQLAEEQGIPGHDLPLTATAMEGQVSGDGSGEENTGEIPKPLSSQLKTPPTEAQDKTLAQVEAGDGTACPIAPNTPMEKELEHTLTAQCLSTAEERPNSDVQLCGGPEFLDAAQLGEASPAPEAAVPEASPASEAAVPEASPASEAAVPEASSAVQAQSPAEVTTAQTSPEALLGAETMKELEEASPDPPLARETTAQAGSPGAQLPPVPGTPLWVEHEEEDAEFVDATDTYKAAEVPAQDGVLEAQEEHSGKDEAMQESPTESPKLIPEEAQGDTVVYTDADFPETSKGYLGQMPQC
ncbi:UNVERIFIED_CONTAM: hypothetical protein K2H54_017130 [Gekko kuhli]